MQLEFKMHYVFQLFEINIQFHEISVPCEKKNITEEALSL